MKNVIESVGLTIHTNEGQVKEIPLEIWQIDVICEILGLFIKLPDLNDYQMSGRDSVNERMKIYHNAIRSINSKNRD